MKDAGGHGSDARGDGGRYSTSERLPVWYHGSPSGQPGLKGAVHLGTERAARIALEARIGIPADGRGWVGDRTYGETLLAGKDTLARMDREGYMQAPYNQTGYNAGANVPKEDYHPKEGSAKYGDGTPVSHSAVPNVGRYQIIGPMTNTTANPYSDTKANAMSKAQATRGTGRNGFYYKNDGEDSGSISAVVPHVSHLRRV